MMPGSKAVKDRLTLLFGGNASSNMKLKLLLVYCSENTRALKTQLHKSLPVNSKAWVIQAIFPDWFFPPLYPGGREILLGEGHPIQHSFFTQQCSEPRPFTDDFHPDVEVVHLPLNTMLLIQIVLPWWLSWERICLQHRRLAFDSWVRKIPWIRESLPLQYSGLENSMYCIVHGVTNSQTRLSNFHFAQTTQPYFTRVSTIQAVSKHMITQSTQLQLL